MATLYTDTPEHAHAMSSEKEAYSNKTPVERCLYLAKLCNKAFAYNRAISFDPVDADANEAKLNEDGANNWVATLWPLSDRMAADVLVAVEMCPSKDDIVVILNARLEVIASNPTSNTIICLSDAPNASISVPYHGVPLVALSHASVKVHVKCAKHPGKLLVRYKVVPPELRWHIATSTHKLIVGAAPLHGKSVYVYGGCMDMRSPDCCACTIM